MSRCIQLIVCLTLFGTFGAVGEQAPSQGSFINGNFETGDFTGWTQGGGYWQNKPGITVPSDYLAGGVHYDPYAQVNTVVGPGPIFDPRTDNNLQVVYNGQKSAKVNDEHNDYSVSVISQTVTNYSAAHIYFAWAAVLEAAHPADEAAHFTLQLKDDTTGENIYQVAYNAFDAGSQHLFTLSSQNWYYTAWQVQDLDVSSRTGHSFTLTLLASDCDQGGHAGYVYLDGFGAVTPPTGNVPDGTPLTLNGTGELGTFPLGNSISGALTASGGTPPYSWETVGTLPPGVTTSGGGSIGGIPTGPGNYSVTLQVKDSQGHGVSGTMSFSVFGFTSNSLPPGIVFSPYSGAVSVGGGTPPYSFAFSGLPGGLNGNTSGIIQGTVKAAGTSQVTVMVKDSAGVSLTTQLPITFSLAQPLSLMPSSLPPATIGQVYSQSLGGAAGGAPPYSWNLSSGSLPDGLTLRSAGTISGMPSRSGTFVFGVRATDVTGASATGAVTLVVSPQPLTINVPTPPNGMSSVEFPSQTFSASGGTPPYQFSISGGSLPPGMVLNPNGMLSGTPGSPGRYSFTVTVTDSTPGSVPNASPGTLSRQLSPRLATSSGTASLDVVIQPFSADLILSSGSADFSLIAGSVAGPAPQLIAVQSTAPAIVIPYSVTVPPSANWVSVSPSGGSTPGTISVSLNSNALLLPAAPTPYQAVVSVTCLAPAPCAGSSQTFTVNLSVTNTPPQLNVFSDLLSFDAAPGTAQALTQTLGLQNAGGGTIGVASVTCAASWCSVAGTPGSIAAGQVASLTVSVDASALTSGYYRTMLTIRASTGVATVPVTLFLATSPSVSLQPSGAQFQALAGGVPNGPLSSFLVGVSGAATVNWTASVLPGASWLTLPVSGGPASSAQPGVVAFSLNPGIVTTLVPGTYYGAIRVTVPGVTNSPQDFQVVLNIGPANGNQRPNPSPAGLLFITSANSIPAPQSVSITTNSVFPVDTQVSVSTSSGGNWLSVTPVTGQAQPNRPLDTQVSVNPSKLAPGVYTGGVSYAYSSLAVRTVNVTLIVSPAPKSSSKPGFGVEAEGPACSPTQMAAAQTGLVNSFAQPTAWPTPLQMLLVTDCGTAIQNGQIVATFSNGDPPLPLNLSDPRSGLYAGTWTPRRTAQQTTITMRATAPGFQPITLQFGGSVVANAAPLLARNSTQHIYNPLAGGALAPGTLVQIAGTSLAAKKTAATTPILPTSLGGTQVIIGGIPAPISAASPGLLNVEIPSSLTPGQQYQVIVSANGAITTPDSIQLTGTAPGLASVSGGLTAASHLDGTAVTEASPAAPGETLVLLGAGLGLTDTPVPDGTPAPASPLANALSAPSITVDGESAAVSFAGLQPGAVGIYQINFTVPTTAKDGDLDLIISQDGQPGNTSVLPVKSKAP